MNWYEQKTNEYESITGKQILKGFGAAGYGAYIILKQIIGQNMNDDQKEWGFVPKEETMATLSEKCGLKIDQFRLFIKFCDERFILEQRDGRLFCPCVLEEKNQYAKRIERKSTNSLKNTDNKKQSVVYKKDEKYEMYEMYEQYEQSVVSDVTTQHNTTQTHKEIDKSIGSIEPEKPKNASPQVDKRNVLVQHTLEEFKRVYSFYPCDQYPRNVAHNLVQRMTSIIKEKLGGEMTDERIRTGITKFFNWLSRNESFEGIQKLITAKLKLSIWAETLKGTYATHERQDRTGNGQQTTISVDGDQGRQVLRRAESTNSGQDQVLHGSVPETSRVGTDGGEVSMGFLLPTVQGKSRSPALPGDAKGVRNTGHDEILRSAPAEQTDDNQGDYPNEDTKGVRPSGVGTRRLGSPVSDDNRRSKEVARSTRQYVGDEI